MSLDVVNVIATVGTFVVIAASAVAALIQLRHMRGSNQITALNEFRETLESGEISDAQRFVSFELPQRMLDPAERLKMTTLPFTGDYEKIGTIANLFESLGEFVKIGIIDGNIACDIWGVVVVRNWNALSPLTTYIRVTLSIPQLWENFEYLTILAKRYLEQYPNGTYPANMPRMPEDRRLLETSNQERGPQSTP
jgi:Domain of unknown function (DUF4760)